ncbi:LBP/BPI/CETP family protein [Salmonella enterica]|nr:LBP/BPI/CETP family protein [Salmonella enterica]
MLKFSALITLLCGLLASPSTQYYQSGVSSQFNDDLTQGLLREDLLSGLQKFDLQGELSKVLDSVSGLLGKLQERSVRVKLINPRLLSVSFKNNPNGKGAEVSIPLEFAVEVNLLDVPTQTFTVRANMNVMVYLKKDQDGKYQVSIENCRALPESVEIQSDALKPPAVAAQLANIEKIVKNLTIQDLGNQLCPIITSWINNLTPQVAGEMINTLLSFDNFEVSA